MPCLEDMTRRTELPAPFFAPPALGLKRYRERASQQNDEHRNEPVRYIGRRRRKLYRLIGWFDTRQGFRLHDAQKILFAVVERFGGGCGNSFNPKGQRIA